MYHFAFELFRKTLVSKVVLKAKTNSEEILFAYQKSLIQCLKPIFRTHNNKLNVFSADREFIMVIV